MSTPEAFANITFIAPGKLRCVITDKLRNETQRKMSGREWPEV